MQTSLQAAKAYAAAAAHRSARLREADVFRRANAALRRARGEPASALLASRALADNDRLWTMVVDLVRDPANALPGALRASLASLGLAVQREHRQTQPNLDLLIEINDNVAAGLETSQP